MLLLIFKYFSIFRLSNTLRLHSIFNLSFLYHLKVKTMEREGRPRSIDGFLPRLSSKNRQISNRAIEGQLVGDCNRTTELVPKSSGHSATLSGFSPNEED